MFSSLGRGRGEIKYWRSNRDFSNWKASIERVIEPEVGGRRRDFLLNKAPHMKTVTKSHPDDEEEESFHRAVI